MYVSSKGARDIVNDDDDDDDDDDDLRGPMRTTMRARRHTAYPYRTNWARASAATAVDWPQDCSTHSTTGPKGLVRH